MVYREITCSSWGLPGDSGNCRFALPQPLYVSRFKVISFSVPLVEFSIDETCNNVILADVNGGNQKVVSIPPGSYSSGNIVTTLQAAINAVAGQTYAVTYNEPQRSLTISAPGGFMLLSGAHGSTACSILGLDKNSDLGPGTTLALPNSIDLAATKCMLLTSSALRSKYSLFVTQPGLAPLCVVSSDSSNDFASVGSSTGDWLWCQSTIIDLDFKVVDAQTLLPVRGLANLGFVVTVGILDDDVLDANQ